MGQYLNIIYSGIVVALFLLFGYFGVVKKVIPYRLAIDAVIGWYFLQLIDICIRIGLTFRDAFPDATPNIENLVVRQALTYQTGQIVMRLVYISIVAFVFYVVFTLMAKKTQERFIDESDVLVFTFGILVAGWPNFLLYFFVVFAIAALFSLLHLIIKRSISYRLPVTPFFVISGIVMIFWGNQLSQLTGLYVLR